MSFIKHPLLIFSYDFPPVQGGISAYTRGLTGSLTALDTPLILLTPNREGAAEIDTKLPYRVIRIKGGTLRVVGKLFQLAYLVGVILKYRIRYVHCTNWLPGGVWMYGLGRFLNCQYVVALHGSEFFQNQQGGRGLILKWVLRRARWVVAVSPFVKDAVLQISRQIYVSVIGNGTNPEEFARPSSGNLKALWNFQDRMVILSVGQLVPRKGFAETLQAVADLVPDHPSLLYLIVGSGPQEGELNSLIKKRGMENHVKIMSHLDDVRLRELYHCADVFVLFQRRCADDVEGFGIVILEAWASGLPVIVGDGEGPGALVTHGRNGFKVSTQNSEGFKLALRTLLADRELRELLGRNGKAKVLALNNWKIIGMKYRMVFNLAFGLPRAIS